MKWGPQLWLCQGCLVLLGMVWLALAELGNPYQILGVHRRASQQDIRKSYKQLVKEWSLTDKQSQLSFRNFTTQLSSFSITEEKVSHQTKISCSSLDNVSTIKTKQQSISSAYNKSIGTAPLLTTSSSCSGYVSPFSRRLTPLSSSAGVTSSTNTLSSNTPQKSQSNSPISSYNKRYSVDAIPFSSSSSSGYKSNNFNTQLTPLGSSSRITPLRPILSSTGTSEIAGPSSSSKVSRSPFVRNDRVYSSERIQPTGQTISNGVTPRRTSAESSNVSTSVVPQYGTTGPKRCSVLIINNVDFPLSKRKRDGALVDEKKLIAMFKGFGFDVNSHRNLKQKDIMKKVQDFRSSKSLSKYDISLVIIMSHGGNLNIPGGYTEIEGVDDKGISTEDIVNEFVVAKCQALKEKPKIFIFQCCRGDSKEEISFDSRPITSVKNSGDILIAYSTLPGFVSLRDKVNGSFYIQCICEVFQQHAKDHHIEDMLKIVDSKMSEKYPSYKQTSTYENRGFKKCYLNPK